ncbi:DUF6522 family protein [Roseivivax sp. CAU 1753]
MTQVESGKDGFVVDAGIIGAAFGLAASEVPGLMKSGAITSRCEKGVDADEGRWRLTFYHDARAFRLTVDAENNILSRARFDAPRPGIGGGQAGG